MSEAPRAGSGLGMLTAAIIVALIAAGVAVWTSGILETPGEPVAGEPDISPPQNEATASVLPALAAIVDAARTASAKAQAVAREADAVATAADQVASQAKASADKAKAAAEDAGKVAAKACKSPGGDMVCADLPGGNHFAGTQGCKGAQGCGPEGSGVLIDKAHGWQSAGQWRDWELVLGCDTASGALTYCGGEEGSAWNGFGISYNANDAAISAEWTKGLGESPMQLDYPTGSRMRGEMAKYELDGRGVYNRADKRVLKGTWQAGKLVSGLVTYAQTGTAVAGDFADGNAALGTITYADGRVFVGRIQDGPAVAEALPVEGVIYSPAGAIIQQGTWKTGRFAGP